MYGEGHVKGAYLAAWGEDLAAKVSQLPTDERVYVYCYSGQTAGQTVALLNMLGIDAVSVKSGYTMDCQRWKGLKLMLKQLQTNFLDAGAKMDKKVLEYVEDYFNTILTMQII